MSSTKIVCPDVATSADAGPSLEEFAQRLQRSLESRTRALRGIKAAAVARPDLQFELPERYSKLLGSDFENGCIGSELFSSFRAMDEGSNTPEKREAQLSALLEAALEQLMISNELFTEMATAVVKQMVGTPGKLISGNALAQMLGISEEAVRQRLQAGKLIAIISAGRERGRGFPIFQAWEGIAGAPLEQILRAMGYQGPGGAVDAADAFLFFTGRNDLLGNFTPVEVLTGAVVADPADIEAFEFMVKPHQDRIEFVTKVARALLEARGA
jgi:hypothetical protein